MSGIKTKAIMSEPRNAREFFIHECDILASRADLDYIIPDELKELLEGNAEIQLPDINTYVLPFGKYRGETLAHVKEVDSGYIAWAKENINKEPVKSLLKQL